LMRYRSIRTARLMNLVGNRGHHIENSDSLVRIDGYTRVDPRPTIRRVVRHCREETDEQAHAGW
jgi:hypothetical protein